MGGKKSSAPAPATPKPAITQLEPKTSDQPIQRTAAAQNRVEGNASPQLLAGDEEEERRRREQAALLGGSTATTY